MGSKKKLISSFAITLALVTIGASQLGSILKVGGTVAAVSAFGKDMNKALNKLTKHTDTPSSKTKVVVILSVGLSTSSAVGAAQVTGPADKVDKVVAVAQPSADILGGQVRVRALIPVSSKNVIKEIKTVEGVGVSGIIDIKL